jgi:hypothetical protein
MKPIEAKKENEDKVRRHLYGKEHIHKPKFKVGDSYNK